MFLGGEGDLSTTWRMCFSFPLCILSKEEPVGKWRWCIQIRGLPFPGRGQTKPTGWRTLCNRALHTWCHTQFISLTAIPLVKPCREPRGGKQTQRVEGDINCLWQSASIGCTSLLHTITFIISSYGSSSASSALLLLDVPESYKRLCWC